MWRQLCLVRLVVSKLNRKGMELASPRSRVGSPGNTRAALNFLWNNKKENIQQYFSLKQVWSCMLVLVCRRHK